MGRHVTAALAGLGAAIALLAAGAVEAQIKRFGGHSQWVKAVAVSPDGRIGLTGGNDRTARLWNMSTGREIRRLNGHGHSVRGVAFSRDGRYALTGSWDDKVRIFEVNSGRRTRTLSGHRGNVNAVAFTPDGRYALSAGDDRSVIVWNASSGSRVRTMTGHGDAIWSVAVSPDGRYALTGSSDKTVRLWEISSGREVRRFSGHTRPVYSVAFTPNGRYALSGSADKSVRLWEVRNGRQVRKLSGSGGSMTVIDVSPRGHYALGAGDDRSLRVWKLSDGRLETSLSTGRGTYGAAFSADGRTILTGHADGSVRLWNAPKGPGGYEATYGAGAPSPRVASAAPSRRSSASTSSTRRSSSSGSSAAGGADEEDRLGLSRSDYKQVQSALNALGFGSGVPDGLPGRRTRQALRDWQTSIGAKSTGRLTRAQFQMLANMARAASSLAQAPKTPAAPKPKAEQPKITWADPAAPVRPGGRTAPTSRTQRDPGPAPKPRAEPKPEPRAEPKPKPIPKVVEKPKPKLPAYMQLAGFKPQPRPRALALVIGNHDYEGATPDVPFAGNDADGVAWALINLAGIPKKRVLVRKNLKTNQMLQMFGAKGKKNGQLHRLVSALKVDELIVFYSGHGVPEIRPGAKARAHLLPVDASPATPEFGGYPLDALVEQLSEMPVERVTLMMDACFSGQSPAGGLTPTSGTFGVAVEAPKAQVSILSATAWDRQEQAYWNEPEKHGAFTWFLLEAMHKADGAGDGDGVVTIGEMHDYVTEGVLLYTVERSEGTTQTPSLSAPDRKHALIRMKR